MTTFEQVLENRQKWITYLKSGEALKTKRVLEWHSPTGEVGRCCLGHACHVLGGKPEQYDLYSEPGKGTYYEYNKNRGTLPDEYVHALGLVSDTGTFKRSRFKYSIYDAHFKSLSNLNDHTDLTPQQIGQYIEDHYDNIFLTEEEWNRATIQTLSSGMDKGI